MLCKDDDEIYNHSSGKGHEAVEEYKGVEGAKSGSDWGYGVMRLILSWIVLSMKHELSSPGVGDTQQRGSILRLLCFSYPTKWVAHKCWQH